MSYRITAEEVRDRLRTMVEVEASDTLLASASYIPMSEAWLDQVLTDNSLAYSTLSTTKQALAKAAQIDRCAYTVLASAPKEAFKAGLTDFRGIDAALLKAAMDALKKEWNELLNLAGASAMTGKIGGAWSGGDDYQPDLKDTTNINWSDETSEGYTRFA